MEEMASAAAKEAVREWKEQERKAKKKKAFQNTNLLLEHYLDLKDFCENAVFQDDPIAIDEHQQKIYKILDEVSGEEVTVRSIRRSREITLIMLSHVDTALELLRLKCEKTDTLDKYTVIDMLHVDPSFQEQEWSERIGTVALELDKAEITIRRWRSDMVNQLGIFLFGLDGLKLVE
jgi:hypothetical protein